MEIQYKGLLWKVKLFCNSEIKISLCTGKTEPNFYSAPTKHKTIIQQSHLAEGKLGRKISPVDCIITIKINTCAPQIKFTHTAT